MNKKNVPIDEDEFMDFGRVDPPVGLAISILEEIANNTDMTREEYEMYMEKIYEKFMRRPESLKYRLSEGAGQSSGEEE